MANFDQFKIQETRKYNPDTGSSIVKSFTGSSAQMDTVEDYWQLAGQGAPIGYGYKVTRSISAQGHTVTVEIPDEILYTERWEFSTEVASRPLWWNNQIRELLGYPIVNGTAELQLETDKAWLTQLSYINKAANLAMSGPISQGLWDYLTGVGVTPTQNVVSVIDLIMRDGNAYEYRRPVVRRTRMIPMALPDSRTVISGKQPIYSTTTLISAFSVPEDIQTQIGDIESGLPDLPPSAIYGWKLRQDNSSVVVNSGKFNETKDWVFDRYSLLTHEQYT